MRLLVCTHAHVDHCGQAAAVQSRSGCELWIHPRHEHLTAALDDPDAALARRIEIARQSGVPEGAAAGVGGGPARPGDRHERAARRRRATSCPASWSRSDLGGWDVHETPGHAPSHVVLHQPERRLLISGDHVLGRISLYFDYGFTPDPVGGVPGLAGARRRRSTCG